MILRLRKRVKMTFHKWGWVASPSLSFLGVPFGRDHRDLALEVLQLIDQQSINPEEGP